MECECRKLRGRRTKKDGFFSRPLREGPLNHQEDLYNLIRISRNTRKILQNLLVMFSAGQFENIIFSNLNLAEILLCIF